MMIHFAYTTITEAAMVRPRRPQSGTLSADGPTSRILQGEYNSAHSFIISHKNANFKERQT